MGRSPSRREPLVGELGEQQCMVLVCTVGAYEVLEREEYSLP
jgi:hypothetical protein